MPKKEKYSSQYPQPLQEEGAPLEEMTECLPPIHSTFEHNRLKVTLTVDEHTVSEVLEAFTNVLRGAGYFLKGDVIIDEEEEAD